MRFIQYWKSVLLATVIVAIPFIIWDVIFTKIGVWGFNPSYHLSINIFGLPLEEILFFICIPYASLFIHYAFQFFFKNVKLPSKLVRYITIILLLTAVLIVVTNYDKLYTLVNFSLLSLLLIISLIVHQNHLQQFYITFVFILIPFFIVNGILTGSFIENEVVWYNNNENLGIRLFTIPVEDIFYAFNMLYASLLLIELFKKKLKNE
jgi:lycopene cyclase domain-containing protein